MKPVVVTKFIVAEIDGFQYGPEPFTPNAWPLLVTGWSSHCPGGLTLAA